MLVKEVKMIPVFTGEAFKYDIHIVFVNGTEKCLLDVPQDQIEVTMKLIMEEDLEYYMSMLK